MVFGRIGEAQSFCEALVLQHPRVYCEIFDREGRTHAPLLVITHPGRGASNEAGTVWIRRRKLIVARSWRRLRRFWA